MNPFKELAEFNLKNDVRTKTKAFGFAEINSKERISTRNEGYEGMRYPGTDVEYRRRTINIDGKKVEGVFPKFDSFYDTKLPKELYKASDYEQFKYCTKQLARRITFDPMLKSQFTPRQLTQIMNGEPRISGLTWHHNETPGKMQLVNSWEHAICRHTGGRSLWGGGR